MLSELRHRWLTAGSLPWLPAVPLVLVQTAAGMWYLPVLSFFPIYLKDQLGLAPQQIATLIAIGQVAGMTAALLGGPLTGIISSKWVLVLGLTGTTVSTAVFQVHVPWLAALLWCLASAALALQTLGGATHLTMLGSRLALGILSAIYALSMTVGGAIGNPIAGVILDRYGFSTFGFVGTVLTLTTALFAAVFLMHLDERVTGLVPGKSLLAGSASLVRRPTVRRLLAMRALPTIFYGTCLLLIPLAIDGLTHSKTTVAAYSTATLVFAAATQLLAGRLADRFGARRPTLVAYGFVILAGLGLALTAGHVWGLFVFGVMAIATAWGLSALMYMWVSDGIPRPEHGPIFGFLHAVWSLSMVTGSLLAGWLVRPAPGLPFLVVGLLNVGSLFLALSYYGRIGGHGDVSNTSHAADFKHTERQGLEPQGE